MRIYIQRSRTDVATKQPGSFKFIFIFTQQKYFEMTDIQLYTKISNLPLNLKSEVLDFIDFLNFKSKNKPAKLKKRTPGLAKGLISMKENFDEPIEGFKDYM